MASLWADEQFERRPKYYIRLHKRGATHAGVVFASDDQNFPALAARIDAALQANPDLAGQLIRVYRPSTPPPQVP